MINRNRWEHRGATQTLHQGPRRRGRTRAVAFSSASWTLLYMTQTGRSQIPLISNYLQHHPPPKEKQKERKKNCTNITTCAFFFPAKVILAAVNLPSQITLLTLRISYVFSSLSSLNLPLSCPELPVASRAGRSEVFKVDV